MPRKEDGTEVVFSNPIDKSFDDQSGEESLYEAEVAPASSDGVTETLATSTGGVPDILKNYISPLYSKKWRVENPVKWEHRHAALLRKVDEMFDQIDTPDGEDAADQKLTKEEIQERLLLDDELELYMVLSGRDTKAIFEEIDVDHDGVITRDEFRAILTARGHSYTIQWLEEQVVWHELRNREMGMNDDVERCMLTNDLVSTRDLGHPHPAWCLMFSVPRDEQGQPTDLITNECAELCNRLWAASLSVDVRRTVDRRYVLILIGISNRIMREEAQEMTSLRMRLAKTKGTIPYDDDYHEHYTRYTRHLLGPTGDVFVLDENGNPTDEYAGQQYTTIWTSALKQQVIKHRMHSKGIDIEARMRMASLQKQLATCRKRLNKGKLMRAQRLKALLTAAGAFRQRCNEIMGDHVDLLAKQCLADPTFALYPDAAMYSGSPVRQKNGIIDDSQSELLPGKTARIARMQQKVCHEHLLASGLPTLTYDDLKVAVSQLETYHAPGGPGDGEQFIGSLRMLLPLHDEEELHFLRTNWGSWGLMFRLELVVKPNEGQHTLAMGHPDLRPARQHFMGMPTGFLYQPIDDIRDYFGDDTAMYFAWLELYARALLIASIFGVPTMINQWIGDGGVDNNSLTVWYSVGLSIWSMTFLSTWKRREAELAFLWGSEGFEATEQPRKHFKGIIIVNEETKREELVYGDLTVRYMVKFFSIAVILLCMSITATCAFLAMGLKYRAPRTCNAALREHKEDLGCGHWAITPEEIPFNSTDWVLKTPADYNADCCYDMEIPAEKSVWDNLTFIESKKWLIVSSLTNLALIQGMGFVYEMIADWLNTLENYRTATEHKDQLIIKNFAFQFVNNYFLLFYIAYLRQIKLGGTGKQCDKSCLGELQMQMLIVFTGKTFGLQVVELTKPYVQKQAKNMIAQFHLKSLIKNTANTTLSIVQAPVKLISSAVDAAINVVHPGEQEEDDDAHEAEADAMEAERAHELEERQMEVDVDVATSSQMTVYEIQSLMTNYEDRGVFDDFNEMAIQYGYVALFSPCFALAPLFAFINNVAEIRGDAWKLCKAYQRAEARPQEDIGSWYAVLNAIGFAAVLTNATMIAFVGSQMAQTEWVVPQDHDAEATRIVTGEPGMTEMQAKKYVRKLGHPDATLDSVMWASVDKNADGWLQASEFPELLNELEMAAMSSISKRADIAPLWVYAMIIEHVVFFIRVVLLTQFPVIPDWIGSAREVVKFRIDEMKKEAKARTDLVAGGQFSEDILRTVKGILHVTVIEAEGLPVHAFRNNDHFVRIGLADDRHSDQHSKQTKTLEASGAAPKWQGGKGETLIFHGIRLESTTLIVEVWDDYVGVADDFIGSVKFPLNDIGLKDDEVPLECWMVLGKESEHMLHHSRELHIWPTDSELILQCGVLVEQLFGYTPHDPGEIPPPESVGRLRLRLRWERRDLIDTTLAVAQEGDVLGADNNRMEPMQRQRRYNDRGLKAVLTPRGL